MSTKRQVTINEGSKEKEIKQRVQMKKEKRTEETGDEETVMIRNVHPKGEDRETVSKAVMGREEEGKVMGKKKKVKREKRRGFKGSKCFREKEGIKGGKFYRS